MNRNILENFSISAAAYHGGDLNGVYARHLMAHSRAIFLTFKITFWHTSTLKGAQMNSLLIFVISTAQFSLH
jgi:hypothetical protein